MWAVRMGHIIDDTSEETSQEKCIIKKSSLLELGSHLHINTVLPNKHTSDAETPLLLPPKTQTKAYWEKFQLVLSTHTRILQSIHPHLLNVEKCFLHNSCKYCSLICCCCNHSSVVSQDPGRVQSQKIKTVSSQQRKRLSVPL